MAIGTRRVTGKAEGVTVAACISSARVRADRILAMQPDTPAVEILHRPDRARSWKVIETISRNSQ